MPERIPQSATIRVPLQAYLSSDHVSPATGKTIAVTISKNGAAYGNPSGGATNAVEIASGSYYVDLSTTDTGTAGPLFVLGTASGVDNVVAIYDVVNANTLGAAALPSAAAGAAGGLWILGANAAATTTLTGAAAAGATPGTDALKLIGGAASTTGGGVAGRGLYTIGGAGAASTNGAASGTRFEGGGTTTVTGGRGLHLVGTGTLADLDTATNGINTGAFTGTTLTFSGAVAFQSTFAVTTSTALAALSCSTLTVSGAVALQSTVTITGATTFTGAVTGTNASNDLRVNGVVPGVANGLLIAGSNAATTFATGSHFIGTVDTVTTTTTATNLTNAPTAGDFTATMKTSLNAATPASIQSVTNIVNGGAITTSGGAVSVVTTVTNQLTAAQVATGVWQDSTAGDFTVASSIGNSLYTGNHAPGAASGLALVGSNMGTVTSVSGAVGSVTGAVGSVTAGVTLAASQHVIVDSGTVTTVTNQLTAAQIATGVWQDATAGDFTTANSVGKSLYNAFTANTSVFTTAALANAPTGGSAPTVGQIATAVWQDLTAGGDFGTAGSIGALLKADVNAPIGSIPTNPYTGTPPTTAQIATAIFTDLMASSDFNTAGSFGALVKADLNAPVGSIPTTPVLTSHFDTILGTPAVSVSADIATRSAPATAQTIDLTTAVPMVNVTADATLTVGKALLSARAQAAGAWSIVGTTLTLKNPDGSTFRVFTLDSSVAPTART